MHETVVSVQLCWSRISSQLEFAEQLENSMSDEDKAIQMEAVKILESRLMVISTIISKTDKFSNAKVKRLHHLTLRSEIKSALNEMEAWQKRFEPPWFQIVKTLPSVADQVIRKVHRNRSEDDGEPTREVIKFRQAFANHDKSTDSEKSNLFIKETTLNVLRRIPIQYCSAEHGVDEQTSTKGYIIETVSTDIVNANVALLLAQRLQDSNPFTFGVPKCTGIVKLQSTSSLALIFRIPDGRDKVQSLREMLLSGEVPSSLSIRLDIAKQLVSAVYYVHLYELVHKNFSPESILSLASSSNPSGSKLVICLVGFQIIRKAAARTNVPSEDRKDNLYQHPSRWNNTEVKFVMQHDIYSLGVCLLEIGLWTSIVSYDADRTLEYSDLLDIAQNIDPQLVKDRLLALSRGILKERMGDTYSKVVEICLTCLDDGNEEFGDPAEFEDEFGVEVGSRYISKIVKNMNAIVY